MSAHYGLSVNARGLVVPRTADFLWVTLRALNRLGQARTCRNILEDALCFLKNLECPVSKLVNSDACPRPTTDRRGARRRALPWRGPPSHGRRCHFPVGAQGCLNLGDTVQSVPRWAHHLIHILSYHFPAGRSTIYGKSLVERSPCEKRTLRPALGRPLRDRLGRPVR